MITIFETWFFLTVVYLQKWLAHFYYTLNLEKNDYIFHIIDQK